MGFNDKGMTWLRKSLHDYLEPPSDIEAVEWCQENVEVATGDKQGPFRIDLTPYLAEPLERFGNRTTKRLTLCFPTQSAKTTLMILGQLLRVARLPQDTLWVLPNQHTAKSFSKSRWRKWAIACEQVFQQIPKTATGNVDRSMFGIDEQHFQKMVLNLVGSNSPTDLASRPAGTLILDECDKYANESEYEPAAIDNAEERTKSFDFPLIAKASTPTAEKMPIWQALLRSDFRKYNVPCPRCERKIVLQFKAESEEFGDCGLRWWRDEASEAKTDGEWDIKKIRSNAHYRCQGCGGEIQDWERPSMLENGIWVPTRTAMDEDSYGYHLNSLYSILSGQTSLANIAIEFLNSKGTRSGLQAFINSWLAETFDESMMFENDEIRLRDVASEIQEAEDTTNIMGVDVQEMGFWVLVRKFEPPSDEYPFGRSWLLEADYVEEESDVHRIQEEYGVLGENVLCDIRRSPNKIGRMVVENGWRGIMGSDQKEFRWMVSGQQVERAYSKPMLRDPYLGNKWEGRTFKRVKFYKFSKPMMLDIVAALRYFDPENPIFNASLNVHESYPEHMNSRVKRLRKNPRTGVSEWHWYEVHQRNHLADTENFVVSRALQLGLVSPPEETTALNHNE